MLCRLALDFQSIIQQWFETAETVKNWTIEEDVLQDGLEKKDWDLLDIEEIDLPCREQDAAKQRGGGGLLDHQGFIQLKNVEVVKSNRYLRIYLNWHIYTSYY